MVYWNWFIPSFVLFILFSDYVRCVGWASVCLAREQLTCPEAANKALFERRRQDLQPCLSLNIVPCPCPVAVACARLKLRLCGWRLSSSWSETLFLPKVQINVMLSTREWYLELPCCGRRGLLPSSVSELSFASSSSTEGRTMSLGL